MASKQTRSKTVNTTINIFYRYLVKYMHRDWENMANYENTTSWNIQYKCYSIIERQQQMYVYFNIILQSSVLLVRCNSII